MPSASSLVKSFAVGDEVLPEALHRLDVIALLEAPLRDLSTRPIVPPIIASLSAVGPARRGRMAGSTDI